MGTLNIISLFSGCGGMDLGFHGGFYYLSKYYKKLNFQTMLASDIDKNACLTYSKNFKSQVICEDIDILLSKNPKIFDSTDIVLGGFPCQDFSHAGKRLGTDSKRRKLI